MSLIITSGLGNNQLLIGQGYGTSVVITVYLSPDSIALTSSSVVPLLLATNVTGATSIDVGVVSTYNVGITYGILLSPDVATIGVTSHDINVVADVSANVDAINFTESIPEADANASYIVTASYVNTALSFVTGFLTEGDYIRNDLYYIGDYATIIADGDIAVITANGDIVELDYMGDIAVQYLNGNITEVNINGSI